MRIDFEDIAKGTSNPIYLLSDPDLRVSFFGQTRYDTTSGSTLLAGTNGQFWADSYAQFSRPVKYLKFTVGTLQAEGGVTVTAFNKHGDLVFERESTEFGETAIQSFEIDFRAKKNKDMSVSRLAVEVADFEPFGVGLDDVTVSDAIGARPPKLVEPKTDRFYDENYNTYNRVFSLQEVGVGGTLFEGEFSRNTNPNQREEQIFIIDQEAKDGVQAVFEIFDPANPDDSRLFTRFYDDDRRYDIRVMEDARSGDFVGDFVVRIKSLDGIELEEQGVLVMLTSIFDAYGIPLLKFIKDLDKFKNLTDASDVGKYLKVSLGPLANLLDIGARSVEISTAKDPARELVAHLVDFAFGLGVSLAAVAGGPLTSLGASFVYNLALSDSLKELGRAFYDDVISNKHDLTEIDEGVLSGDTDLPDWADYHAKVDLTKAPVFDEDFYLREYPEVADFLESGAASSAYAHYLSIGVYKGYRTYEGQTEFPHPNEVIGAGISLEMGQHSQPLQSLDATLNGDGASAAEKALQKKFEDAYDMPDFFNLEHSVLWKMANRKAWDLAHNYPDQHRALTIANAAEDLTFSNGETIKEMYGNVVYGPDTVRFFAVAPKEGTAEAALAELQKNFPQINQMVDPAGSPALGFAEYGGIWVVAISIVNFGTLETLVEDTETTLIRGGTAFADVFDFGTRSGTYKAGDGHDTIKAGHPGATLKGQAGNDLLFGRDGNDTLIGGKGFDNLDGRGGKDNLSGGEEDDLLLGGSGKDRLLGGSGNDRMDGGTGNDTAKGGAGDDVIRMGMGNDAARGGAGDDTVTGEDGNDRLKGEDGDDVLDGGAGRDRLSGGDGRDTFVFAKGSGVDRVTDFQTGRDTLQIESRTGLTSAADLTTDVTKGGNFELRFSELDKVILVGLNGIDLTQDLVFV
ncbi:MAG: calcium-binding protein [Arenibacterium sp.]